MLTVSRQGKGDTYQLIERLMDESFKSKDKTFRVILAVVEKQARECYAEIQSRLRALN